MAWQETRKQLKDEWNELEQSFDELRVKAHLFGMTAKQELSNLEPKILDAKERLEALSQETVNATRSVLSEVKSSLAKLKAEAKKSPPSD